MLNSTTERSFTSLGEFSNLDAHLRLTIENHLNTVGSIHNLEPLGWSIRSDVEGICLDGGPIRNTARSVEQCEAWARVLGMTEYTFDLGFGTRTWYLNDGMWHIEVSTEPIG